MPSKKFSGKSFEKAKNFLIKEFNYNPDKKPDESIIEREKVKAFDLALTVLSAYIDKNPGSEPDGDPHEMRQCDGYLSRT